MEVLRGRRNMLLRESDWTQFSDAPITDVKKAEWVTYRQALRDLPAENTSPTFVDGNNKLLPDVTFPTKP
jgi:hypothetical protein